MTQTELIKQEIERHIKEHKNVLRRKDKTLVTEAMFKGSLDSYEVMLSFIESLEKEQKDEIEKEARISPGMLSNFGTSSFVLDVELTQEEQMRLGVVPGFSYGAIKIKILCE